MAEGSSGDSVFRHGTLSRFERLLLTPSQGTKEDAVHRMIGKKMVCFKKVCEREAVSDWTASC